MMNFMEKPNLRTTLIKSDSQIRKGNVMLKIVAFLKRHPVEAYYALVFVISFGSILIVLGPGGFLGTGQTSGVQLYVGGPLSLLGPSIAGVLMTSLIYGKAGLRNLLSRLFKWRVRGGWYAVALLTAPLLTMVLIFTLSLTPAIATASDKASLIVSGLVFGCVVPFFEELGWTGFAIPEIRKRHSVLATGLIMGLLWGVWHFPVFSASAGSSGPVQPTIYLAVMLFSWLIPYRVLIVWVYDHTHSLLVAILMHLPLIFDQFVLFPQVLSGTLLMIFLLIYTAGLWLLVMAVVLRPQPLPRPA
jgi:uncharacterized protein